MEKNTKIYLPGSLSIKEIKDICEVYGQSMISIQKNIPFSQFCNDMQGSLKAIATATTVYDLHATCTDITAQDTIKAQKIEIDYNKALQRVDILLSRGNLRFAQALEK